MKFGLFKHRETKILDISFVTGVNATVFGNLFDTIILWIFKNITNKNIGKPRTL